MGNLVSKGSAFRLWTTHVTEFFLLSNWNLSSCNIHPLFPVLCLRPRKKQAYFPFCGSHSAPRGEAVGSLREIVDRQGPILPDPRSPLRWNSDYETWLTGWLWRFKKMWIRHLVQFLVYSSCSVTDYHYNYYWRRLLTSPRVFLRPICLHSSSIFSYFVV